MLKTRGKTPKTPPDLGAEGRKFWRQILQEFEIEDSNGRKLLHKACKALDNAA